MNTFIKSLILTFLLSATLISAHTQNVSYVQIIHNSADLALDTVDIYFEGVSQASSAYSQFDSSFVFHAATGYIPIPTDSAFSITIYKNHSHGNSDSIIKAFDYDSNALGSNERAAFILSGVLDADTLAFAPNPDGRSLRLSMDQVRYLDSIAFDPSSQFLDTAFVSARFFQGCTDLPGVTVKFRNQAPVFSNPGSLLYGDTAQDVSMRHGYYEFQVISPDTTQNFGTYSANFSGLGGQPIIILTSGFVNINTTDSTKAFALYAVLNNGSFINLPLEATGFQLLHNSADTSLDSLDIYVDSVKAFPNMPFRNATPALVFKAYRTYNIGIARKNSASVADTFWNETFFFPRDTFFIATISGLLSQTGYAANPDGISTAFQVLIKSPAEFESSSQQNFDFYMLNGVTDAPSLNLVPTGGPYLLTNVDYADQTNYVSLPSEFYALSVQDTEASPITYLSGFANFLAFNAQSGVLLTSGFMTPANNNNGPAMGLYLVPTYGGPFIPLYTPEGIHKINDPTVLQIFPNPASNQLHVIFTLPQAENVSLQITDINGKQVKEVLTETSLTGNQNAVIDLSGLSEGLYFTRLITNDVISNSKFAVVR